MTKEERKKAFLVILTIAVLSTAVTMNREARDLARRERLSRGDYYDQLESRCDSSCCEASVERMRQARATVQPSGGCAAGETADMLRCIDSYRWCEPAGR